MKLPFFKIDAAMEQQALDILNLSKCLDDYATSDKYLELRKNNRILSIQSSLAIEANSLSLQQVTDIINGKKVIGNAREIREVKNAWQAYENISNYDPGSIESLLKAHKIMSNGLVKEAGKFRSVQVNVYKNGFELVHEGARPEEIEGLMNQLFEWLKHSNLHPIIKSCIIHFTIEYIHPFEDGNGRIGRLWQTVILNSWNPIFEWIPVETMVFQNQQGYYNTLALAEECNNINIFIEYILGIIKFTLEKIAVSQSAKKAVKLAEKMQQNDTVNDTLNRRILLQLRRYPEISAQEISEKITASIATVKRRIAKLKEAGIIKRVGSDKTGHWEFLKEL